MSRSEDLTQPGKLALKGFSLAARPSSKAVINSRSKDNTSLGKRSRSAFQEADEDDQEKLNFEAVTEIGEIEFDKPHSKISKVPLIIPRQGNKGWGAQVRGSGKDLLPPEVRAGREGGTSIEAVQEGEKAPVYGLNIPAKRDGVVKDVPEKEALVAPPLRERTLDEQAIDVLLGADSKGLDLVIPMSAEPILSEDEAYRKSIAEAPDVPSLDEYDRMPVEEFGMAMLRGMGLKEKPDASKEKTTKVNVKKFGKLQGLGSKVVKDAEELGAWVSKSDTKKLRPIGEEKAAHRPRVSEYRQERRRREDERSRRR